MEAFFFYLFGGLAVVGATLVVFLRRPVHNAMALIFLMICVAGLFFLLHAEFIAVLQVLVYAGAIMVLFLFVIMLLNLDKARPGATAGIWGKRFGVVFGIGIFILLAPVWTIRLLSHQKETLAPAVLQGADNTVLVARMLFREYLLPFETASILLLAAIVGAVYFVMKSGSDQVETEEGEGEQTSSEG